MGKALYRKYRSRSLDEIVGQSHITEMLRRAIDQGATAHAYLLTGPRGVGKTSIARILAHEINRLPYTDESTHLDIIEIDAASNNSVEDIRDLREKVQVAPVSAPKKIYIIDEVHMLSKSAFNALLKTLEEPPEHAVFILATTDADKLPATILSRVQRFNFRTISQREVAAHLRTIASAESINIEDEALDLIALHGQGSFRDSISLLDQLQHVSDGQTITKSMIERSLGLASGNDIQRLLSAYIAGDIQVIVDTLDLLEGKGIPASAISQQLLTAIRQQITQQQIYLPLVEQLLAIQKTAWPYVKLLVALSSNVHVAPTPTSDAPIKKQKSAAATPEPKQFASPENPELPAKPPKVDVDAKSTKQAKPNKATKKSKANTSEAEVNLDWNAFLQAVKQNSTGAHAILQKCGYALDDLTLTIYAGKKFSKTQLEKSLPALSSALQSLQIERDIAISDQPKPPKDSQTAAVLAIMGGGEELDEVNV